MSDLTVPAAITRFIETTNAGDSEGFVAAFTEDAHLDDWGRVFSGHAGVASWDRSDNIGKRSHFELVSAVGTAADTYVVTLVVTGDGYNGTGPMTFVLDGDRIASLVIAPA